VLQQTQFFVINLKHRTDRRSHFQNSLKSSGYESLNIKWFDAIFDGDFGGLGCAKSHLNALIEFITTSNCEYVGILEDDFVFRNKSIVVDECLTGTIRQFPHWDVLLLSGGDVRGYMLGSVSNNHNIIRVLESQTTSGYISHRKYVTQLISLFSRASIEMENLRGLQPRNYIYSLFAIDQVWKHLQKFDFWVGLDPMVGTQYASFSDIENRFVDYSKTSG